MSYPISNTSPRWAAYLGVALLMSAVVMMCGLVSVTLAP